MTKILMVCLGNICRSPLAHGILKSKLDQNNFLIDSAGTSNYHIGDLPDRRSIDIASKNDLDITDQRGRQFKVKDFDEFDLIYVMDESNMSDVLSLARNDEDAQKVKLILNEIPDYKIQEVPDPYYGGRDGFKDVYNMLNEACDNIAKKLTQD
ncbi:protein-tyrosine phosphatase [Flavobacteriaceae bacterium MAR_2010_188]|nr:protein-tyrosine phosphatase [Flavobacteriaceae bacterium MAR_2010_188]